MAQRIPNPWQYNVKGAVFLHNYGEKKGSISKVIVSIYTIPTVIDLQMYEKTAGQTLCRMIAPTGVI